MSEQIKIEKCTSCGSDQIVVAGNKFLCRPCNVVYEVTDTGTKVLDANPLDALEQRFGKAELAIKKILEQQQGGGESESQPDDQEFVEDHPEPTAMDENEPETEEDGFIIFE